MTLDQQMALTLAAITATSLALIAAGVIMLRRGKGDPRRNQWKA